LTTNNNNNSFFQELKRRNVYRVGVAYAVVTWLLLQILDTVAPIIDLPAWAPRLVLTLLIIGFPVAMLFAWAYELTPEGLKREKDVDRSQSITSHTGQRLDRIIIGVLLVVVGLLLIDKFLLTESAAPTVTVAASAIVPTDSGASIAVLPFVNMSADASSTYFSDGLADTVLHMLAQVRELRVAARTSSFQFRDQTLDIADIGKQLNVGAVLEGSVQRAGDKIRVTAQLIDVSNGFHLWSGNFDRNLDDVFAIQDEIASEVVAALKVSLLGAPIEKLGNDQTDNIDAYTEYLLAISDLNAPSSESLALAVAHLQEAVRLDPEYARAWSSLGRAYFELQEYGSMGKSEALTAARDAASRALELVPDSSEAMAVLGKAEFRDGNLETAGALLSKAIETGPNDPVAMEAYATYLSFDAHPAETVAAFKRALRLDPLSENAMLGLVVEYTRTDNFTAAGETLAKLRSTNPRSANAAAFGSFVESRQGNLAAAIAIMKTANDFDPADPEPAAALAQLYLIVDMPREARQWIGRAAEIDAQHPAARAAPLFLNYYLQENDDDNFRLARELLNDDIDDRRGSRFMALSVLVQSVERSGRYDAGLDVLDNLYPYLFDDPPRNFYKDFWGTYFVGRLLMKSGDVERGTLLLRAIIDEQDRFDEAYDFAHRVSVEARLLLGDIEGAMAKLSVLASDLPGFNDLILFEHDSVFNPIRNEPAFVALLEKRRADVAAQQQLLQATNDAR
jgi:TolB-like protein/Flp pilus assembly protein TadD